MIYLVRFTLGTSCPYLAQDFPGAYEFNLTHEDMPFFKSFLSGVQEHDFVHVVLELGECNVSDLGVGISLFSEALRLLNSKLQTYPNHWSYTHIASQGLKIYLHVTLTENRELAIQLLKAGVLVAPVQDSFHAVTMTEDGECKFNNKAVILLQNNNDLRCYGRTQIPFGLGLTLILDKPHPRQLVPCYSLRLQGVDVVNGLGYVLESDDKTVCERVRDQFTKEPVSITYAMLDELGFKSW